ncbi:MAG: diacylglycerol kinase family lipid kinase [Bacillota bacterium]|nr:diacylglycerol kinase family lipid kinase [Bacillota bacterium]
MGRTALIVNPIAGDGKCLSKLPKVESILTGAGFEYTILITQSAGHAVSLAKQAAQDGFSTVISMGGDGTLNEVVNGLVGTTCALGFIPAGSGNDFGRTFGLRSGDLGQACTVILQGNVREIDLGYTEGKYFLNVAGAGFDAEVGHMANVWGKQYFPGHLAYIASILRQLVRFSPRDMHIELDGKVVDAKAWLVAVGNARFFGGGMMIAPAAEVDDRLFDICVVGATSKLEFLKVLPKVFKGDHVHHKAVKCYRASHVKLSSNSTMVTQADGEILGTLPREFIIAAQRIKVILPK